MISPTSIAINSITNSKNATAADVAIFDIQQRILLLDAVIAPTLHDKAKKKLTKIEDELDNCNFLINTGLGSKDDKAALRKTKRQLRDHRTSQVVG
jgi:hypothetical protein